MLFVVSKNRRQKLINDALISRRNETFRLLALGFVLFYNLVGVLDVISTTLAIEAGLGEEANPVVRAAMTEFGSGWIAAKLLLQSVVSVMVLWFPHPFVLALFGPAVAGNAVIVLNNFAIVSGG